MNDRMNGLMNETRNSGGEDVWCLDIMTQHIILPQIGLVQDKAEDCPPQINHVTQSKMEVPPPPALGCKVSVVDTVVVCSITVYCTVHAAPSGVGGGTCGQEIASLSSLHLSLPEADLLLLILLWSSAAFLHHHPRLLRVRLH